MALRRQRGIPRGIALLSVLLFTALTLLASGPHPLDRVASPAERAGIVFAHAQPDVSCPLCDWIAHSTAVVAAPPDVLHLERLQDLPETPPVSYLPTPTVPRATGRAPPLRFA